MTIETWSVSQNWRESSNTDEWPCCCRRPVIRATPWRESSNTDEWPCCCRRRPVIRATPWRESSNTDEWPCCCRRPVIHATLWRVVFSVLNY